MNLTSEKIKRALRCPHCHHQNSNFSLVEEKAGMACGVCGIWFDFFPAEDKKQRLNIDIDREIWRRVSVRCAETGVEKRRFVEQALELKLSEG